MASPEINQTSLQARLSELQFLEHNDLLQIDSQIYMRRNKEPASYKYVASSAFRAGRLGASCMVHDTETGFEYVASLSAAVPSGLRQWIGARLTGKSIPADPLLNVSVEKWQPSTVIH